METRKDIGQAFKESLSEFKDSPNDFVWEQLELNLKKKQKKKRLFFFWFRYGSVALIILSLLLLNKNTILNSEEIKIPSNENTYEKNNPSEKSSNNEIKLSDKNALNGSNLNHLNKEKSTVNDENKESNSTIVSSKLISKNSIDKTSKKPNSLSQNNKLANDANKKLGLANDSDDIKEVIFQNNSIKSVDQKYANNTVDSIQKTVIDSLISNKEVVENPIDKKITSEEKDSILEIKDERWSVYPNLSMVYYDGFKKSFENQISINYGLYFNYSASDRFNIRIGVHKLDLQQSYKPNDSILFQQRVKYLEIPLEFKYKISNGKIKSHVVTGFSYLILDEATISTTENNLTLTNSNSSLFTDSNVSLNLGLSFQTKIYKNFHFNIEPIFKYHIKPYLNTTEFNPYTISIITGIEYKF